MGIDRADDKEGDISPEENESDLLKISDNQY